MEHVLKKGAYLQGGSYRIEAVLGQGTFGITYLATMKEKVKGRLGMMDVDVKVAIKEFFMSDVNGRKADGNTVEGSTGNVFTNYRHRFRKEAENLAQLSHPSIVQVFDVFDENNTSYYAMRFIDGESLDSYIGRRGHLNEDEAIAITTEVGRALDYMHARKMLHLDIKPSNIMRDAAGRHYLIDFGLSKQFSENGNPETSTSIGLGTPGYAPIEQSTYKRDGSFPATLDVYALGASMFKMLTGKCPPEASQLLNEDFPVAELKAAGVSDKTIAILQKAMMPGYKNRYQSVGDFLNVLNKTNGSFTKQADERTIFEVDENLSNKTASKENEKAVVPPIPESAKSPGHQVIPNTQKKKSGMSVALLTIAIIIAAGLVGWLVWKGVNSSGSSEAYSNAYDDDSVVVEEAIPVEEYEPVGTQEKFKALANSGLSSSDNELGFYGNFMDGKKEYPIKLIFKFNQNYIPTSCQYINIDYKAKVKMDVNFAGEKMILSGKVGGSDFTISLTLGDDGIWRGSAKNGNLVLDVEVWPIEWSIV